MSWHARACGFGCILCVASDMRKMKVIGFSSLMWFIEDS